MANKMLIDASHPEETRVVVLRGNRVEEFDFESANRKQLRGNIYLAKVTRVEPSLQAAFVDYGGNRHGFLAFSEIHPDYYQIPVADRQALIEAEARAHRDDDEEDERRRRGGRGRHRGRSARRRDETVHSEPAGDAHAGEFAADPGATASGETADSMGDAAEAVDTTLHEEPHDHTQEPAAHKDAEQGHSAETHAGDLAGDHAPASADQGEHREPAIETIGDGVPVAEPSPELAAIEGGEPVALAEGESAAPSGEAVSGENGENGEQAEEDVVESVGGADAIEEVRERAPRYRRQYKIQEVIKRRQVMLVQVVKEERGTKGAALTTYLSLAGRYSVLMPNTARGGGISRKITSAEDRGRLKEIAGELDVPEGMGVILRTAGASRTKTEVKRDFEYLLRLWETVRDLTLKSTAPKLVYEEGSLTKRSIRDLYNKDIDEIIVSGEQGHQEAKEFMRMLMPSHARNVKLYRDSQPIFTRYGIESQLDAMFSPVVQLRSGGYIVLNQAEALVAIDVNSGRATREHHIEDTALKTNIEAAEEVARQLRLRDLAGLIVIDFIDMDEGRNNRTVERRLKEALRHDRARIQVGRISHFGLMEMSRQRIRTSVLESSTEKCPTCGGSGHVRSVSSVTLALLRAIEETLIKGATHNLIVRTRAEVALYILNQKRGHLRELEERFRISVTVNADPTVVGTQSFVVERGEQVHTPDAARAIAAEQAPSLPPLADEQDDLAAGEEFHDESEGAPSGEAAPHGDAAQAEAAEPMGGEHAGQDGGYATAEGGNGEGGEDRDAQRRRRRRGGRGRRRGRDRHEQPREGGSQFPRDSQPREGGQQFAPDSQPQEFGEQPAMAEGDDGQDAPQQGAAHEGHPGENGDGARRRRRRGRRGGRRNRHRNGERPVQHDLQGGNDFADEADSAPLPGEPFAPRAKEPRYDTPPGTPVAAPAEQPQRFEIPQAVAVHAEAPQPAPEAPARRRSTVREAAPVGSSWSTPASSGASASAPATPVVTSPSNEEPAQPKRGWWGKRLLGGKE